MAESVAVPPYRASIDIDAPPETVFPYFTRPEAIVTWMGDYAELDAAPDGIFSVDVNGVPIRGRYLQLEPPHRLLISWGHAGSEVLPPGASTLEVTLTAIPGGTRVSIEHRDLPAEEAANHAVGWPHYLRRLASVAAGHDPGRDPFASVPTGGG